MDTLVELPDPTTELGAALELALAACDEADMLSMASFRRVHGVETKPDQSFVTAADRAIEQALRTRIAARFPGHGLVGEEYGEHAAGSGWRWIIDPIDGTHAFMRGVPIFATLLALEVNGQLDLGVVSAPGLARRWFAWRGGGAWVADTASDGWRRSSARRIWVSEVSSLEEASVVYSSLSSVTASGLAPGFEALLSRVWRDRGLGDFYGYVLVAEGAAEVMIEAELKVWDLAAPRAVLEEAGARLTDLQGGQDMPATGVVASNGHVHELVLDALARRKGAPG